MKVEARGTDVSGANSFKITMVKAIIITVIMLIITVIMLIIKIMLIISGMSMGSTDRPFSLALL